MQTAELRANLLLLAGKSEGHGAAAPDTAEQEPLDSTRSQGSPGRFQLHTRKVEGSWFKIKTAGISPCLEFCSAWRFPNFKPLATTSTIICLTFSLKSTHFKNVDICFWKENLILLP